MSKVSWKATVLQNDDLALGIEPRTAEGCLVQIHPLDLNGGLIKLPPSPFVIGRDGNCNLCLFDESVSRRHASIEQVQSVYIVNDLGSTNGIFLNGERITRKVLRTGDRLRLGNHILKFLSQDHIEAQYHETVYSMMTRDGLTGAYNKRYFGDVLEREIKRVQRHNRPMALILFDIDHFKQINDTHGHLAGDEVLQELSRRIHDIVRQDEVFARYGGEEFAMVLGEASLEAARDVAERCRLAIETTPFQTMAGKLDVTISVGVASVAGGTAITANGIVELADSKLYEAKQAGRNQIRG
jgi:diguanylate cyclase (GGDEF)-like protein